MILSGYQLAGRSFDYDLCIVGTGAAGQTLFSALRDTRLRIALIESGGVAPDARTRALNEFSCTDFPIDLDSRERRLGGTTNLWQSKCVSHDEIDFARRDWVPNSGWPLSSDELAPYYDRAADFLQIPRRTQLRQTIDELGESQLTLDGDHIDTTVVVETARLAGFEQRLYNELRRSRRCDLFVFSNLIDIRLHESGRRATSLVVSAIGRRPFTVSSRAFVLACGGIENARILLMSNRGHGVGNSSGCVGRYFMDHPKFEYGVVTPFRNRKHIRPYQAFHHEGVRYGCGLRMRPDIQRSKRVLNSAAKLVRRHGESAAEGSRTARYYLVKNFLEMAPSPSNRITLGSECDALGCPKVAISCRLSDLDKRTMVVFHKLLEQHLRTCGFGAMVSDLASRVEDWPPARDASHHMGTTRMGEDPTCSVVNADCRLHDLDNLYVAGSSVFPTSGHANPTYTIVALALRLADTLRKSRDPLPAVVRRSVDSLHAPGPKDPG